MSKVSVAILAGFIVLVLAGGSYAYFKGAQNSNGHTVVKGNVIFGVTDQAVSLDTMESIKVVIDNVQVHQEKNGWIAVSEGEREFNLLDLKERGAIELLAQAQLPEGAYDQIRLGIQKVVITKTNGQILHAQLPSGDLRIIGKLVVQGGKTSSVVVDFLADESLHLTGSGKFMFFPVIKLQTRSGATVQVAGKEVEIAQGIMEAQTNLGMDENGEMKEGFALSTKANIEILQNNVIRVIPEGQTEFGISVGAKTALNIAKEGAYIETPLSVSLTRIDGKKLWQVSGSTNLGLIHVFIDASTGAVLPSK